jgi:hypothetical protein
VPVTTKTAELIHAIKIQRGRKRPDRPLPPALASYLMLDHLGRRICRNHYRVVLKKLTRHIPGAENIHPHRLRHTFATEMARAGMTVPALMRILGHETPAMTMRYVEVAATDLRRCYHQALARLSTLNNLQFPDPPTMPHTHSPPADPEQMMELLVNRLESARRDAATTNRARQLQRFLKRMRKAGYDLKALFQEPT